MPGFSIPVKLTCEYNVNPIGVFSMNPLLGWCCENEHRGGRQSAYQILVASKEELLINNNGDIWDSGKIESSQSVSLPYGGSILHSEQRAYWKVRIWDELGAAGEYSIPAFFEMGLLLRSEWKGKWMGFLGGLHGQGLLIRKDFELREVPVRARAYISGLGYYELRLNGQKVGDKLLDPGSTDYSKTVLYSSYDVTDQLKKGMNVVGAILGNGWHGSPRMLLQLNIEYSDGSKVEVHTAWGIGWYIAGSPITYNGIYDGEDYDARIEKDGWDTAEYDFDSVAQKPGGWILATVVEDPGGELIPELMEPIRVVESYKPVLVHKMDDGTLLYDIGQNLAGWVRIGVRGEAGADVVLKFAETIFPDNTLNTLNLRLARASDRYILRGLNEREEYAPRFTYHGFRYFTVKTSGSVEILDMTAEFVRSDIERAVNFSCGNQLLNKLAEMMYYTDASNMHSIPTDCCQRDERQGWINDVTVRAEGSTYNFNVASFYEKWVRDIYDTQSSAGYLADTAPYRWGSNPCDPDSNSPICIPLLLYRTYGNRRILTEYYENMKKYVASLLSEADDFIINRSVWGDWASPAAECYDEKIGASAKSKNTSGALVSTAYLYLDALQMAEIAEIVGADEDISYYKNLAVKVKDAYNDKFFNTETAQYYTGSQGSNSISVGLGLVPEQFIEKVVNNIDADVVARGYHLSTGSQSTKQMFGVLSKYGKIDTAFRLMTGKTYPGYGHMVENGATTIWERWESDNINNVMNSRNQPMHASVCVWFYKHIAGLMPASDAIGFNKVVISPCIPDKLSNAQIKYKTINGCIEASWEKSGKQLEMNVVLPFNTTARVILPVLESKGYENKNLILTESSKPIFKDGKSAVLGNGIYSVEVIENKIVIEIGSGKYEFSLCKDV
ncbi:MAG TPA: family 78 glycoside hydrolase catalytic domain [Ruminiclostridium sp.]